MDKCTTIASLPLSWFLGGALPVGNRAAGVLHDAAALNDVMDGEGETTIKRRTPTNLLSARTRHSLLERVLSRVIAC